ncbi:hypothetical protein MOUN0_J04852 [Monosporozyma unispora]
MEELVGERKKEIVGILSLDQYILIKLFVVDKNSTHAVIITERKISRSSTTINHMIGFHHLTAMLFFKGID